MLLVSRSAAAWRGLLVPCGGVGDVIDRGEQDGDAHWRERGSRVGNAERPRDERGAPCVTDVGAAMNPRRRLACAAGFSFLVAGLTGCGDDAPLSVGEPIRHDDFLYTVLAAQPVEAIGNRRGQFVVVHFAVTNRALRVSHRWTNHIAYLVDAADHRHENDDTLQRQLEAQHPFGWHAEYVTAPGAKQSTMLVFELPSDAPKPLDLMVRGELLMGDVLDGARFRRARVRLP